MIKLKRIPIAFIILLISFISIPIPGSIDDYVNAESAREPIFNIVLDDDTLNADVQPGSNNSVMASGNVSLFYQKPWDNVDRYIVELIACADQWTVSDQKELVFTKNTTLLPFLFLINVPPGTSSSVENSVVISGSWRSDPGDMGGIIEGSSAKIIVETYHDLTVESDEEDFTVNAGESVDYRFRIINNGNIHDRFTVEIMNIDHMDDMGWNVQLSQDKFQIREHDEVVLTVSVMPRNETPPGDYPLELRFVSQEANIRGGENFFIDYDLLITILDENPDSESTPFARSIYWPLLALVMVSVMYSRRRGPCVITGDECKGCINDQVQR